MCLRTSRERFEKVLPYPRRAKDIFSFNFIKSKNINKLNLIFLEIGLCHIREKRKIMPEKFEDNSLKENREHEETHEERLARVMARKSKKDVKDMLNTAAWELYRGESIDWIVHAYNLTSDEFSILQKEAAAMQENLATREEGVRVEKTEAKSMLRTMVTEFCGKHNISIPTESTNDYRFVFSQKGEFLGPITTENAKAGNTAHIFRIDMNGKPIYETHGWYEEGEDLQTGREKLDRTLGQK